MIDVEIVTSYPGDVSTLPWLRQGGEITTSNSRLCFEDIVLIPAVVESLQGVAKSKTRYVFQVNWAPPNLVRPIKLGSDDEGVVIALGRTNPMSRA